MPYDRQVRRRLLAAAALALVPLLGACAAQQSTSIEQLSSEPVPTEVPDGTKLVFADQNEEVQTLMKASGEGDALASDTEFANFIGGPEILEAIRADAVDVAYVGDTPPIQAQAAGELVPIVAAVHSSAPDYQFAVRPGLEVNSLEEFEGKKIAYAEGTGRQPMVLRALAKAGLSKDDVELVPLDASDFPDAIRNGQVDVAPLNEPHFTRYMGTEGASAVPEEELEGLTNGLHYVYARGDSLADPAKAAAIRDFVQHFVAAYQWSLDNPEDWVQAYHVDAQQLSKEEGLSVVEAQGEVTFPPLDDELIARQQDTIDTIHDAGELPEELDAKDEFATQFDEAVAEAVEQAGASRGSQ